MEKASPKIPRRIPITDLVEMLVPRILSKIITKMG